MEVKDIIALLLVGGACFFFGFFSGQEHERNKYKFSMQGQDWELRYRKDQPNWAPEDPYQEPRTNKRVRVWPFVDVEVEEN